MRRVLSATAVAAVFALPGALGASASAAVKPSPGNGTTGATGATVPGDLAAALAACHADPVQANRSATFAAQMSTVAGTTRMSISLELQERKPGGAFTAVSAPGFGVWLSSSPGVSAFRDSQQVTNLPAPASFRVVVLYRWLDRAHRVIRRDRRVTPACPQPLLQPDLAVSSITKVGGVIEVGVRNGGTAAAGPFEVALGQGATTVATKVIAGLGVGERTTVSFPLPSCAKGGRLTVTLDPAGAVAEPSDPGRVRTIACRP